MLISVTGFFRNPEAFDVLKREILPRLLARDRNPVIRVWVLGCSTGQEAYSLAIAFSELLDQHQNTAKLQIFATDLNEALLDKARAGLYSKSLVAELSPERLDRYFVEGEGGYRVVKRVREMVVFARQNLISDPPFSRIDLISCRNLLIYLDPILQKRLLPLFHYSLKQDGYLFLGASESIGQFTNLFEAVDGKHKIFAKKPGISPLPGHAHPRRGAAGRPKKDLAPEFAQIEWGVQREADRLLVNEFAPPGVLIDERLQIQQSRGDLSAYLRPATGKATFDVLKMAKEGLVLPLRAAIRKAKRDHARTRTLARLAGNVGAIEIEVVPLRNVDDRHFLVLFEPGANPSSAVAGSETETAALQQKNGLAPSGDAASDADTTKDAEVAQLRRQLRETERELSETRDYLQSMQEQSGQRGAAGHERRSAIGKRGAAEHQRGAANLEGGARIDERRVDDGE